MPVEIRTHDGEMRPYTDAIFVAFAESVAERDAELWTRLLEQERALAAYDGDRIVGTAAALSLELTIPGGILPAAGVTTVGVHPTHRRRGILRQMMERQLHDVHERGEPLAALWASEASIYQRFGYGLASYHASLKIDRHRSAFRRPHEPTGTLRLVSEDEARSLFPPVYEAARAERVGFFGRSQAYWDVWVFHFPEAWRHGRGDPFHAVHETDGVADGFVRYAVRSGDVSELSVLDQVAATPAAHIDLWRYLFDVDLMSRVENWNVAIDDPLLLTVAEARRLEMKIGDALWLRIVDVAPALAGRRYRADGRVVIELIDALLPWNAGRWSIDVEAGIATVALTDDPADLTLDTTDLAAAYLGGNTFGQLAAARRVAEQQPGAIDRADLMFGVSRAPWVPSVF
jgi:predicted acetyltransferase